MAAEAGIRTAVLILNWNGREDTLECLKALRQENLAGLERVVIDNGSSDGSVAAIRSAFPEVTVLENGSNLGYAEGNNRGIRYALARGAEYILILNNDVQPEPGAVSGLVATLEADPALGILGPVIVPSDPEEDPIYGARLIEKEAQFALVRHAKENGRAAFLPTDFVLGCAMLVRRRVFEALGMLDAVYFLTWEEIDFCFRARRAGFSLGVNPGVRMRHTWSVSFPGGRRGFLYQYYFFRNRMRWIERNMPLAAKAGALLRPVRELRWARDAFRRSGSHEDRVRYEACRAGLRDYLLRRFGPASQSVLEQGKRLEAA